MMRSRHFLLPVILALAGCATLGANEHANMLSTAVGDDQTCAQQGLKYPDITYVSCRMQLQDDRLHKAWLNLQLMKQTNIQPNQVPPPYTGHDIYRPLDLEHFDCQLVTEEKRDYILCSEDEKDQKP